MPVPSFRQAVQALHAPPASTASPVPASFESAIVPETPPRPEMSVTEALAGLGERFAAPDAALSLQEGSANTPSGVYDSPFGLPYNLDNSGHLNGQNFQLRELYFLERLQLLRTCHQAWERNPWAKAGVRLIRAFTVGTGHRVTYRGAAVKEVLERFRSDPANAVEEWDKQLCEQLLVDGELFVRFMPAAGRAADGTPAGDRMLIDPIPPWWVEEVEIDPQFRRVVTGYRVRWRTGQTLTNIYTMQNYEIIPVEEILHVAINKFAYETRGRPELWAILPWLQVYKQWLEDRSRINRYKGALLYDVTIKQQTAGTVAAKRAQYATPPSPGSVVIHSDNEQWATVDSKIDAGDAAEDGRQLKLAFAVGLGLPEFALADGSNSNRATSTSQQLPMLAIMEDYQDVLANSLWGRIYMRVIDLAIKAGTLSEEEPEVDADGEPVVSADGTVKVVKVRDAYEVTYPDITEQELAPLVEALSKMSDRGLLSDVSFQERAGFDPNIETKRLAAQQQAQANAVAAGLAIGERPETDTMPPGEENDKDGEDSQDEDDDDQQTKPAAGQSGARAQKGSANARR